MAIEMGYLVLALIFSNLVGAIQRRRDEAAVARKVNKNHGLRLPPLLR